MNYERTHYEACLDIDYAIELNSRHIKLYRHLRWLFSLALLVSGSAVFVGSVAEYPQLAKITGGGIALLAIIDHLAGLAEKAARHVELRRRWCDLRAESAKLKVVDLDRRMSTLYAEDVHIITALQVPSFNANLRRHGREDCMRKLNIWEWFCAAIA